MNELLGTEPMLPADSSGSAQLDLEIELLDRAEDATSWDRRRRGASGPRVLVIEDDADMRRYVSGCLLHVGIDSTSIVEACSAERAMAALREQSVDLVITDIVLPGIDGLELVRGLRNESRYRDIPVLVITGESSARDAEDRVRDAGVQAVLIKPFNARSLGRTVRRLLGSRLPPAAHR